jgi:succinoglycan biosynthesis protein ExoM
MIDGSLVATAHRERICVAIPTFRRPDLLRTLLAAVALQSISRDAFEIEVVVIDNDTRPSMQDIVESMQASFPFPLTYAHVPEPGLSSVRNFALAYVEHGFHFLAMIDDDERPQPQWLAELLRVQRATNADAVIGPVPHEMPPGAPRWMRVGRFYDLPSFADGATITFGYSGNCLLRLASFRRFGVSFARELNFAGGEDLLFFRELVARGAHMTYAANAIAPEPIPPSRLTASYILQLNFRRGNTLAICDRRLNGTWAGLSLRAFKGCARLGLGLVSLVPRTALRGRAGAMKALCDVALGLGNLAGLAGYVHLGYRRVDTARV